MPLTEDSLIGRIATGDKIGDEDEVTPGYRGELMRLMAIFVDSELAGAAGFVDVINRAPGLRERIVTARIVSEKFNHAEEVLALLEKFGVSPELYVRSHPWAARLDRAADLQNRRIGGDKRLNVFHYPLEGWIDSVTMNMLMGAASSIQLAELVDCSYAPLADAMKDIVPREERHARFGETGLAQAIERASSTVAAQASVDYWFPRVAATFGRLDSDRFELYKAYGLRQHSNADLLDRWLGDVRPRLKKVGLTGPA
ncbi:MAG: phenylacetate-CoA oxygenase subunit PaaI [Alphaproteobacteria bacterium]|nr:phenylacetate-CoA oxygenase subunit PaaI [Alphaproteobacteria bacterium]